jgi:hypothetical protein
MIKIDVNQNQIEKVIDSLSNLKIENIDYANLIKELENYKKIYNIVKSNRDFLEHFKNKNRNFIVYLCIKNDGKSLYLKNSMYDRINEESKNIVLKIWFTDGEKIKLDWNNFISIEWFNSYLNRNIHKDALKVELINLLKQNINNLIHNIKLDLLRQDKNGKIFILSKYNCLINILHKNYVIKVLNDNQIYNRLPTGFGHSEIENLTLSIIEKIKLNSIFLKYNQFMYSKLTESKMKEMFNSITIEDIKNIPTEEENIKQFLKIKKEMMNLLKQGIKLYFDFGYICLFCITILYGLVNKLFDKQELETLELNKFFLNIESSDLYNINLEELLLTNNFELSKIINHKIVPFNKATSLNHIDYNNNLINIIYSYSASILEPKYVAELMYELIDYITIFKSVTIEHTKGFEFKFNDKVYSDNYKELLLDNIDTLTAVYNINKNDLIELINNKIIIVDKQKR